MEIKYPIKYAIMPIIEQTGRYPDLHELGYEYSIVANIVSKCYVVGERKEYLKDGTFNIKYEVVFQYDKSNYNDDYEPIIPKYNIYSQCINSMFVNQLFNNFDEALAIANQLNREILENQIKFLPPKSRKKVEECHQETLEKYKKIEQTIEQKTCDMKVTQTYSSILENIIEKILTSSSKFYIKLTNILSIQEIEYLKQLIENRSYINQNNYELIDKQLIITKTDKQKPI